MFVLPTDTLFYSIERAIKTYRKLAQEQIHNEFGNITIDQALVLIFLNNNQDISQVELGDIIFKDKASVTRMIELLRKNGYLTREIHQLDRRRFKIRLTQKGIKAVSGITQIVVRNREIALEGITEQQQTQLKKSLNLITENCSGHMDLS